MLLQNWPEPISELVIFCASIEAFFDKVMVMDDDPEVRLNRLNLLAELKGLFDRIANLALLG